MQSLKDRLKPLLSGAVSVDDLDNHTRQALSLHCHFRAIDIVEGRTSEQIKAELARLPESVREVMRIEARKEYKRMSLEQNIISPRNR